MHRKQFLCRTLELGLGTCGLAALGAVAARVDAGAADTSDELEVARNEAAFVRNWVADLVDTMEEELPRDVQLRLIAGCGRGCFRRHEFKRSIAEQGKGSVDELVTAYKKNFEAWREGETVHVRYGETSSRCYCPVVKDQAPRADDLHCECTRSTHQSIFETALGRPIDVEVVETLRRGGRTCHFVAHVG